MARLTVLIVDDEKTLARSMKLFLEEQGYEAEVANDSDTALEFLEKLHPDLVFLDVRLPGVGGIELLRKVKSFDPSVIVVMMTAHGTIANAVEAIKLGGYEYLTKPIDLDELKLIAERAQEDRRLRQEVQYYREREARDLEGGALLGTCPAIREVVAEIGRLGSVREAPAVLLTGETGTGKSLVARALHARSPRARGPFVEVDCTSLPASLVEVELFGYEKGSFTDARESKVGLIEAADGGTAFLDELGDLEVPLQGKLLRAIEEHTVRRVGSVRDRKVDVWILAATNKDLGAMLVEGTFRKDLYFRLAVVTLNLPPLRDRGEDIGLLAEFFLKRFAAKYAKHLQRLSPGVLEKLSEYPWPGNVRELTHVIERVVLSAPPAAVEIDDIPLGMLPGTVAGATAPKTAGGFPPEGMNLFNWERAVIERALVAAQGNQARAARLLGVSRDTLRYRVAKFKIDKPAR
jgi:two-component system, NtrC family, response regulator AtoC